MSKLTTETNEKDSEIFEIVVGSVSEFCLHLAFLCCCPALN